MVQIVKIFLSKHVGESQAVGAGVAGCSSKHRNALGLLVFLVQGTSVTQVLGGLTEPALETWTGAARIRHGNSNGVEHMDVCINKRFTKVREHILVEIRS